jgi:hypothetical protein
VANISAQYTYLNAFQSLTREEVITNKVIDTVFKSNKAWQWLRQKGMYDDVKGGAALTWPINVGKSPNTTTFDGDDTLPIASMNSNILRAALPWKRYTDALAVNLTDIADNNGSDEAIANLLDVQLDITKASLIDKISFDWILNTQSINPKGLDGLAEIVDNGSVAPSYAGFSRTVLGPLWQGNVNYLLPATSGTNTLASIHLLDLQASIDGQRPDFYFTNTLAFAQLIQSLWTVDRYNQPEMARAAGGNDLIFNGNPLFLDQHTPTGVASPFGTPATGTNSGGLLFGLNSSFIKIVVNPQVNFALLDWALGQNNLVLFTRILWFANLVGLKPSTSFQVWIQGA